MYYINVIYLIQVYVYVFYKALCQEVVIKSLNNWNKVVK